MSILYLEKRGCNFRAGDERVKDSDIGNYRVTTAGYCVNGKNGKTYHIEFVRGNRWNRRDTNKRTNRPLKHPVMELVTDNALFVTPTYISESGHAYGDLTIASNTFPYTEQGILDYVNSISAEHYDRIEYTLNVDKEG